MFSLHKVQVKINTEKLPESEERLENLNV